MAASRCEEKAHTCLISEEHPYIDDSQNPWTDFEVY